MEAGTPRVATGAETHTGVNAERSFLLGGFVPSPFFPPSFRNLPFP